MCRDGTEVGQGERIPITVSLRKLCNWWAQELWEMNFTTCPTTRKCTSRKKTMSPSLFLWGVPTLKTLHRTRKSPMNSPLFCPLGCTQLVWQNRVSSMLQQWCHPLWHPHSAFSISLTSGMTKNCPRLLCLLTGCTGALSSPFPLIIKEQHLSKGLESFQYKSLASDVSTQIAPLIGKSEKTVFSRNFTRHQTLDTSLIPSSFSTVSD